MCRRYRYKYKYTWSAFRSFIFEPRTSGKPSQKKHHFFRPLPKLPPNTQFGMFFHFWESMNIDLGTGGRPLHTNLGNFFSFLVSKSIWVPTAPPPRPIWALPKRKGVFSRKASPWGTLTISQKIQCVMSCPFFSILQLYNDDDNDDFTRVGC